MSATLHTRESFDHSPVMAEEIVALFGDVPHGVVVDATLGGAGHTTRLLEAYPWMSVLGIDQDDMAIEHAAALRANSAAMPTRFLFGKKC